MTKADKILSIAGAAFFSAILLHLLNQEFPATTLSLFISETIEYVLYFIGGLFILGFFKNENEALHITVLLLSVLLCLTTLLVYLTYILP